MPTLANIKLDLVDGNPLQPRLDMGDVAALAASIAELGVVEPVIVAISGKRYLLIAGHRRVEASKLAGLTEIPAVVHDSVPEENQIAALMAENTVRVDLTVLEEAGGVQTMLNCGWKEPGSVIGRTAEAVEQSAKIAAMPAELKVKAQQANMDEALALAEFAGDKKATKAVLGALGTGNLKYVAASERRRIAETAVHDRLAAPLKAAGVKIVGRHYMGLQMEVTNLRDEKGKEITPEQHASCPGHAAIIETYGAGKVIFVCADYRKHGHFTIHSDPKAEAKRAKERAAEEKLTAQWADSRVVRLEFVRELMQGKLPAGTLSWAFDVLLEDENSWSAKKVFAEIWGSEPTMMSEKRAPGAIVILAAANVEGGINRNSVNGSAAARNKRYLELLMTEGYELSAPERIYYDECVKRIEQDKKQAAAILEQVLGMKKPEGGEEA